MYVAIAVTTTKKKKKKVTIVPCKAPAPNVVPNNMPRAIYTNSALSPIKSVSAMSMLITANNCGAIQSVAPNTNGL